MKSKLKFFGLLIVVCLAICAVFAGCLTDDDYEAIFNDDAKIATSTSNKRIGSVETSHPGSYKLSCSSFYGVMVIKNNFYINKDTSANLSLQVTEGKLKVVLVKGKSVYTLKEGSYDGELDLSEIPDGTYKVKIVGVNAEINLHFTYELGVVELA